MPSRTQLVCLCEGKTSGSIDEVFINRLMRNLKRRWMRPPGGSNVLTILPNGGRTEVIRKMPVELKKCLAAGAHTTLMVWADCDHTCTNGDSLRTLFWQEAQRQGISKEQFNRVIFILPKDRLENWIEFLRNGDTDESKEGPRVSASDAVAAAKKLADYCAEGAQLPNMPPSLQWSCRNWRALAAQMT